MRWNVQRVRKENIERLPSKIKQQDWSRNVWRRLFPPHSLRHREGKDLRTSNSRKNAGLITQAGVLLRHTDDRSEAGQSFFSMFQNIGIAAPFVTPVSEVRQMLGTLYSPSGM